jgi:hypothetical protein
VYNGQLHNVYVINDDDDDDDNNNNNLANLEMGRLLTRSSLSHPEVSLTVSPCFFSLLVCSFLVFSLLQGILFARCNQCLLFPCIFSKTGVVVTSFAISVFVL